MVAKMPSHGFSLPIKSGWVELSKVTSRSDGTLMSALLSSTNQTSRCDENAMAFHQNASLVESKSRIGLRSIGTFGDNELSIVCKINE
jgi:PBP1b-binding outer membrane lipoprotein LpoB